MRYTHLMLGGLFVLIGCKAEKPAEPAATNETNATKEPIAAEEPAAKKYGPYTIEAKSDATLTGEVTLEPVEGGVRVLVSVENAPPGEHGTHIHEKGDCSAPDGTSAGGHFDPTHVEHGLPTEDTHHLGDLGNLKVSEDGSGTLHAVMKGVTLEPGGDHSYLGRALIFHEKVDDGGQPTGNAGKRLGCAVLKG